MNLSFEAKFKEGARAADSVDRLRNLQLRLEQEKKQKERRRDLITRGALISLIAMIVSYAISKL